MGSVICPLCKFFKNPEINSIITTILLFFSLYTSIVTLFGESFWLPLTHHEKPASDTNEDATIRTVFVIFLLLLGGIFAVRASKALRLPQLFGALALGILIRNITVLNDFFVIPPFVETMIRKVALTMIVIRWGLATDVMFLYKNAVMPVSIGLVSVIGEIIAVTIASYFILSTSLIMSVFCALILVIVSPAVTVPAMIFFKEQKLGALKKIPENVLAVCCVDNLFCVIIFMVLSSIVFTDAPISTTILLNVGTIIAGIIGGIIIGPACLLRLRRIKPAGFALTWKVFFLCITLISIGLFVRAVLVMMVTHYSHFNIKEKIVIALSLLPRATFQADLAPTLLLMTTPFPEKVQDAELIMKAAILSVLVTAPIFDILLNLVGTKYLVQHREKTSLEMEEQSKKRLMEEDVVDAR